MLVSVFLVMHYGLRWLMMVFDGLPWFCDFLLMMLSAYEMVCDCVCDDFCW